MGTGPSQFLSLKMKKRTIALLVGLICGVVVLGTGAVLAATTFLSCPSVLYDQDLYYGGASVASLSALGLAYTFRERVGTAVVAIVLAAAVVMLAVFLAGFLRTLWHFRVTSPEWLERTHK